MIVLSHTGGTGYAMQLLERARQAGAVALHVSGIGNGGDLETVAPEASACTRSATRERCGWRRSPRRSAQSSAGSTPYPTRCVCAARPLRAADRRPRSPGRAHRRRSERVDRTGGCAEDPRGLLRRRRGTLLEQFFHGPSVALDEQDTLVARRRRTGRRAHGGDRPGGGGHRGGGRASRAISAKRCRCSR